MRFIFRSLNLVGPGCGTRGYRGPYSDCYGPYASDVSCFCFRCLGLLAFGRSMAEGPKDHSHDGFK